MLFGRAGTVTAIRIAFVEACRYPTASHCEVRSDVPLLQILLATFAVPGALISIQQSETIAFLKSHCYAG